MVDYDQTNFYGKIKRENHDILIIFHLIKSSDLTEHGIFGNKQEIKTEQQRHARCILKYTANIYSVRQAQ